MALSSELDSVLDSASAKFRRVLLVKEHHPARLPVDVAKSPTLHSNSDYKSSYEILIFCNYKIRCFEDQDIRQAGDIIIIIKQDV